MTKANKVFIIAEAGVNHNGSLDMAKQLIDAGAKAGVDCVKFQTWVTEDLITKTAPKATYQINNDGKGSQFDMLKALELSHQEFRELKKYSEEKGVYFLSTPDEKKSLDFLVDELGMSLIKIGSGEVNNLLFLKQIAQKKKPIILSTGMCDLGDIETAVRWLEKHGAPSIQILHCTSEYPAPVDTINLKVMDTLRSAFQMEVGYSDHTEGIAISLAAVAMGASIIEKHFTLDKTLAGPDHKASINPEELQALVNGIRQIEMALGSSVKNVQSVEIETKKVVGKGIFALQDIEPGQLLTDDLLVGKRPVEGLSMKEYSLIAGKPVNKSIKKGTAIHLSDIRFE